MNRSDSFPDLVRPKITLLELFTNWTQIALNIDNIFLLYWMDGCLPNVDWAPANDINDRVYHCISHQHSVHSILIA